MRRNNGRKMKGDAELNRNPVVTIAPVQSKNNTMRVAAYCRVSSDSQDQLHSFAAQIQYYTKLINENELMEFVDIYADEGLTGTKTTNRDDFNRLINDCKKGKIDRVLTKSISRFARNTADALMYARILRNCGVSILFEKENIDTAYMSSELLLAISGAQAQEESISISKNMRWSAEKRMKNGTYVISIPPYGYRQHNGELEVIEEEAEVVRQIFKSFLSGMGKKAIAVMLEQKNVPKRFNDTEWKISTIDYILRNERYIGDAKFKKKYKSETLPFKTKRNYGEKAQYYVENMNVPIISKEDFYAVQKLLSDSHIDKNKYSDYPLTRKIKCNCGKSYKPLTVNGKRYWECSLHNLDSSKCNSKRIAEKAIYEAFITMVNKLYSNYKQILTPAVSQIERLQMKTSNKVARIKEIDREIAELNGKQLVISRLNSKGIIRAAEYTEQSGKIIGKTNALRKERRHLLAERDGDSVRTGLRRLNDILSTQSEPLTEFDEVLFKSIVEKVTISLNTQICFSLLGGLQIKESIPDQRRCTGK